MFYIEEFINHLKMNQYSYSTLQAYRKDLGHFEAYLAYNGIKDAMNISKATVMDYLKALNGKAHPTKAYCNQVTRIIKYLHYLEEEGIIFLSPLRDYSIPKHQTNNYPVIGKVEMEKILMDTKTFDPLCIKGKAIIELAYSSALRPREVYELKIPNIDFKQGLLFIEQSKNKKDRVVPVGRNALAWIEKYLKEVRPRYIKDKSHSYVFINHKTGERLTVWGVRWAIQETLRRSRIKPIKPYSLRVTSATHLLLNGMNIVYISKLLGHSSIKTTRGYLHVDLKQLKQEIKTKHPRVRMEKHLNNREKNHEI
ncbi:MAG: tyrosine-type recombinase/integrase [Planctomycetes bacterium]|nr:tyrosine-type recombinase/integrase [Planctomycetota bacterium]